eukprot:c22418_g1_i1.p1 GENE.c22418_g1_i1~~c22418_g1_i1.p1  ORF type:complete len:149 (-),score=4.85 c22418_g1_i1:10-405(-)
MLMLVMLIALLAYANAASICSYTEAECTGEKNCDSFPLNTCAANNADYDGDGIVGSSKIIVDSDNVVAKFYDTIDCTGSYSSSSIPCDTCEGSFKIICGGTMLFPSMMLSFVIAVVALFVYYLSNTHSFNV